jgi:anti-sigma28 factor (negative regulator of flagellin synthesis)
MQIDGSKTVPGVEKVRRIARPESVVLLAATVRAALDVRGERIDDVRAQLTDGAYAVPTRDLAERVLANVAPSPNA